LKLFSWLTLSLIPPEEIRAEIWALGGRHRGEALKGAMLELKAPDITKRRSDLLRAVIGQLKSA
jgi:hypothetical protein